MDNLEQYERMLLYEIQMCKKKIRDLDFQLKKYPDRSESLIIKSINGNQYYYCQWMEDKKLCSRYVGAVVPGFTAELERNILEKQKLEAERENLFVLFEFLQKNSDTLKKKRRKEKLLDSYQFEVYWKNEITARVYVKGSRVQVARFIEHPVKQIFYSSKMNRYELGQVFQSRCWDQGRPDLPRLLNHIGLKEFNPEQIVRKTHGVMSNDCIWFRFPGEKLTAEDVLVRK